MVRSALKYNSCRCGCPWSPSRAETRAVQVVDVLDPVGRLEQVAAQGVEIEPLVVSAVERGVVVVEGVDVDPRPHGSGYDRKRGRRPLRGVAPRSRSTEGDVTHETARSQERKVFPTFAAAEPLCTSL